MLSAPGGWGQSSSWGLRHALDSWEMLLCEFQTSLGKWTGEVKEGHLCKCCCRVADALVSRGWTRWTRVRAGEKLVKVAVVGWSPIWT